MKYFVISMLGLIALAYFGYLQIAIDTITPLYPIILAAIIVIILVKGLVYVLNSNFEDDIIDDNFEFRNTSLFVPKEQISGLMWSSLELIKEYSRRGNIYLGNFITAPSFAFSNHQKRILAKFKKTTKFHLQENFFSKMIILIGEMGAGKTFILESFLDQFLDKKFSGVAGVFFNDEKGETYRKFGRKNDICLSLVDKQAVSWNMWKEYENNPVAFVEFLKSFVKQSVTNDGNEGNAFFHQKAADVLIKIFQNVYYANKDKSHKELYALLVLEIKKKRDNAKNDDSENDDVYNTLDLAIEFFERVAYKFYKQPKKSFCVADLQEERYKDTVIYLMGNAGYDEVQKPFFSAIITLHTQLCMQRTDEVAKNNKWLMIIDEALTSCDLQKIADQYITKVRSKQVCFIFGVQFKDTERKHFKKLESSAYCKIYSRIEDDETLEKISKSFGKIEYVERLTNKQISKTDDGKTTTNTSNNQVIKQREFITAQMLKTALNFSFLMMLKKEDNISKYDNYDNYIVSFMMSKYKINKKNILNQYKLEDLLDEHEFYEDWLLGRTMIENNKYSVLEKIEIFDEIAKADEDEVFEVLKKYDLENENLDAFFKDIDEAYKSVSRG